MNTRRRDDLSRTGIATQSETTISCPNCDEEFPHSENINFLDHFETCGRRKQSNAVENSPQENISQEKSSQKNSCPCPHCGKLFKRVKTHISKAHPEHSKLPTVDKHTRVDLCTTSNAAIKVPCDDPDTRTP
jgi:uncharacterized C2H2 Zn-finger protein